MREQKLWFLSFWWISPHQVYGIFLLIHLSFPLTLKLFLSVGVTLQQYLGLFIWMAPAAGHTGHCDKSGREEEQLWLPRGLLNWLINLRVWDRGLRCRLPGLVQQQVLLDNSLSDSSRHISAAKFLLSVFRQICHFICCTRVCLRRNFRNWNILMQLAFYQYNLNMV